MFGIVAIIKVTEKGNLRIFFKKFKVYFLNFVLKSSDITTMVRSN